PSKPKLQLPPEHFAEQFPLLAVEAPELRLFDKKIIVRRGVEFDARQHQRQLSIFDVCGLLHNVFTREIITALFEHLNQQLRLEITYEIENVDGIAVGVILSDPGQ